MTALATEVAADTLLEHALAYAAEGWRVFPCHTPVIVAGNPATCSCRMADCSAVGKHPRTKNGFSDATTDETIIRQWWKNFPDANIGGIPASAGLLAFDLDSDQSITAAREIGLFAEPTFEIRTGNGVHRYYRHDQPLKSGAMVAGIIVRSAHGYVLLPPSRHYSGRYYEIADSTRAKPLPPAALEAVAKATSRTGQRERVTFAASAAVIPPGERHAALMALAGSLAGSNVAEPVAVQLVQDANVARCDPPKPANEVADLVRYAYEKERQKHAEIARPLMANAPKSDIAPSAKHDPVQRLALRSLSEMDADPELTKLPEWVLQPFFERGTLSSVYGPGKIGKSSMLADMAVHVGIGKDWAGHAVAGGRVLWIDLEQGPRRLLRNFRRVRGWHSADILTLSDLGQRPDYNALLLAIETEQPALVVIDSLGKFCEIDDDNDNRQWQKQLKPLEELARTQRAAFVVIDHDRKAEGEHGRAMRGASSKLAAFDTAIHMKRGNGTVRKLEVVSREMGDIVAQVERTDDGYRRAGAPVDRILEALVAADEPVTVKALHFNLTSQGLAVGEESVRDHMARLVASDQAVVSGTGTKNDPKRFEPKK